MGGWHDDPCRGSLGLLPSGPDPVGEWFVHRQPPALYLALMATESKRARVHSDKVFRPLQNQRNLKAFMFPTSQPNPQSWSLHPQLAQDTVILGDLPLSHVLIIKDANYPWLLLVPRCPDIIEITDLDDVEQAQLIVEINRTARALKATTICDKLNIAALGNVVPQLHIHIIARRKSDAAWPKPVWGQAPAIAYDKASLDHFMQALKSKIWIA